MDFVSDDLKAIWPGLSLTVINLPLFGAPPVPVWATALLNLSTGFSAAWFDLADSLSESWPIFMRVRSLF